MAMTLSTYTEFIPETCIVCGCQFAMTKEFKDCRLSNGENFYCPNGHVMTYGEGRQRRLERELAQERAAHDQTKAAQRTAVAEAQGLKAKLGLGQCPCCDGKFRNLRNHIQRKHPEFAPPVRAKKKT